MLAARIVWWSGVGSPMMIMLECTMMAIWDFVMIRYKRRRWGQAFTDFVCAYIAYKFILRTLILEGRQFQPYQLTDNDSCIVIIFSQIVQHVHSYTLQYYCLGIDLG